jgi:sugar/nucleoside kinase (ribokinase family)
VSRGAPAPPAIDVLGIGNAIVDVLAHADEGMLMDQGLAKGTMTLVDAPHAEAIYAAMGAAVECSGGSSANTMAGAAALGARAAFIGRVRDDQLGQVFGHDIRAAGVRFEAAAAADGPATGRCRVMVTPDAQRTMGTYLGAATELAPNDIDPALVQAAAITYVEAYLWDRPSAKDAVRRAIALAHEAGRRVSLSLSDPFCVERHRDELRRLVEEDVDILFANEAEAIALYEGAGLDEAIDRLREGPRPSIAALTRSELGSIVLSGDGIHVVPAEPVAVVVDTTGAGDLYAAGFLWALTNGLDPGSCAVAGSVAAAAVIGRLGARPDGDLAARVLARLASGEGPGAAGATASGAFEGPRADLRGGA